MKKFVGLVNGQTFDNEKDWAKAAEEAIKNNDGNLAISSYYKYANEEDEKKEEPKDDEGDRYVSPNEYFLGNREPDKVGLIEPKHVGQPGYTNMEYEVYPALEEKLKVATNKNNIKENINYHINNLVDTIKKCRKNLKDVEDRIDELQKELEEQQNNLLNQEARRKYYNRLLDILEKSEQVPVEESVDECECEKCADKKPEFTIKSIKDVLGLDPNMSLTDMLRKLNIL